MELLVATGRARDAALRYAASGKIARVLSGWLKVDCGFEIWMRFPDKSLFHAAVAGIVQGNEHPANILASAAFASVQ